MCYPNLRAERSRKGITIKNIADKLGLTSGTVSLKLNGKYPITLDEAKQIKEILNVDIPLEVLFEEGK